MYQILQNDPIFKWKHIFSLTLSWANMVQLFFFFLLTLEFLKEETYWKMGRFKRRGLS